VRVGRVFQGFIGVGQSPWSMIPNSGHRFSVKIMLKLNSWTVIRFN
jgi:hypothetical protein